MAITTTTKWDVTGKIPVTDSAAVCDAVTRIVHLVYPEAGVDALRTAFVLHERIYEGHHPDYHACETGYHDKRHVLDVTLAAARLLHGHEMIYRDLPKERLGADLMRIGILVALFHDVGYIRHREDRKHFHGAQLTKTHVSRSADFLAGLLPLVGFDEYAGIARWLVHFTGYEVQPEDIPLDDKRLRRLGCLIGTADAMAQMASDDYLEKCRDDLFEEFALGGVTVTRTASGEMKVLYSSGQDLLEKTPEFMSKTLDERLERAFGGCYRLVEYHFGGRNPYMEAIQANLARIRQALQAGDSSLPGPS